ncbi:MAG: hypothetical protein V4695_13700 [Pseudomonadota bacterium]
MSSLSFISPVHVLSAVFRSVSSKSVPPAAFANRSISNVATLQRMAFELDTQQPLMAAELRLLAAQG